MNNLLRRISICDITGKSDTDVELVHKLFTGLVIDTINNDNSIVYSKDGIVLMRHGLKTGYMWCDYDHIWSIFMLQFGLDYKQIQATIVYLMERHLKIKGLTPEQSKSYKQRKMERHFKINNNIVKINLDNQNIMFNFDV